MRVNDARVLSQAVAAPKAIAAGGMKKQAAAGRSRPGSSLMQEARGLAASLDSIAGSSGPPLNAHTARAPQEHTRQRLQMRDMAEREERRTRLLSPKAGLGEVWRDARVGVRMVVV